MWRPFLDPIGTLRQNGVDNLDGLEKRFRRFRSTNADANTRASEAMCCEVRALRKGDALLLSNDAKLATSIA